MNENGTQIGALALDLHALFFLCALCGLFAEEMMSVAPRSCNGGTAFVHYGLCAASGKPQPRPASRRRDRYNPLLSAINPMYEQ
jgi:hypothetical protein